MFIWRIFIWASFSSSAGGNLCDPAIKKANKMHRSHRATCLWNISTMLYGHCVHLGWMTWAVCHLTYCIRSNDTQRVAKADIKVYFYVYFTTVAVFMASVHRKPDIQLPLRRTAVLLWKLYYHLTSVWLPFIQTTLLLSLCWERGRWYFPALFHCAVVCRIVELFGWKPNSLQPSLTGEHRITLLFSQSGRSVLGCKYLLNVVVHLYLLTGWWSNSHSSTWGRGDYYYTSWHFSGKNTEHFINMSMMS